MSEPFLSIAIGTRERAETLGYAIETALATPLTDIEVVVSDNCSADDTPSVLRRFAGDPRFRAVRSETRLSMCDNWELALSHAQGQYIAFIGDDDAIMPGSLERLKAFHAARPADVYRWPTHIYTWPIDSRAAEVTHLASQGPPRDLDLARAASLTMSMGGWKHYEIPCMYHSAVARWVPDAIRARTGRVFHSTQPDVFLSGAIPAVARTGIDTGFFVSVHGRSQKSHGGSSTSANGATVQDTFVREYGDYRIHPTLYPGVTIKANLIPDALLLARDLFPDFCRQRPFNYDAMWAYVCRLQRFFKWDLSEREVLAKRRDINRYHRFRPSRFLGYRLLHLASDQRRAWLSRRADLGPFRRHVPDNIRDFTLELAAHCAGTPPSAPIVSEVLS